MKKVWKFSLEEVIRFVKENSECELLSNEYEGSTTKMKFKCYCGEIFYTTFSKFKNRGKRKCSSCSGRVSVTIERFSLLCKEKNLILLEGQNIKGNKDKLTIMNKCGYKVDMSFECVKKVKEIPIFHTSNKFSIENIKKYIDNNNIECELISSNFTGYSDINLTFKCRCGEEFIKSLSDFKSRKRYLCKKCAKNSVTGENHHSYNKNLSVEERTKRRILTADENMRVFRESVFERDSYTCVCCTDKSTKGKRVTLNAHHLNGYHWFKEGRFDINNGVTLCKKCHSDFHKKYGRHYNTKEQFHEYIKYNLRGGENID